MTVGIFQKMRETFGNEECEFCGRLFFSKVDYEPHVRTHTGRYFSSKHRMELCCYLHSLESKPMSVLAVQSML